MTSPKHILLLTRLIKYTHHKIPLKFQFATILLIYLFLVITVSKKTITTMHLISGIISKPFLFQQLPSGLPL